MTKKELLEKYRQIVLSVESMEKQSAFLNQYVGGPRPVRSPRITGMPRGTNDPEAAMLQRADYDDAIFAIEKKSAELRDLVDEFERIMDSITDGWNAIIIRDYYALGYTDKQIANRIGFGASAVWKRRNEVINALDQESL